MAIRTAQGANCLKGFRLPNRFEHGIGAQLPEAYKKFWYEWRVKEPAPVHYIAKEGQFERNDRTGDVRPIQNIPISVRYPREHNEGIWGGEGIIKGFQKRTPYKRRVPHFWVPVLKKTVVFSAVLNQYFDMIVTDRTLTLILENHGFDHYLLKTPACDLKSTLALNLKRNILEELERGCPLLNNEKPKQTLVLNEYKKYLDNYSSEEIEWYGLTFSQAVTKIEKIFETKNKPVPHKILFREKLIEQLKIKEEAKEEFVAETSDDKSWINKLNPFSKKEA